MNVLKLEDSINKLTNPCHIEIGPYCSFYISSAGGNCKLMHISDLGFCLNGYPDITITRIKEILNETKKLCFEVNINRLDNIKLLNKHFPIIFCNEVPIGYNNSYTYFALFLNVYTDKSTIHPNNIIYRLQEESKKESFKYKCIYKKELANGENLDNKIVKKEVI